VHDACFFPAHGVESIGVYAVGHYDDIRMLHSSLDMHGYLTHSTARCVDSRQSVALSTDLDTGALGDEVSAQLSVLCSKANGANGCCREQSLALLDHLNRPYCVSLPSNKCVPSHCD